MLDFEMQFLPDGPKKPILAAACKRLTEKGLYRFTMAEVAKTAEVSRPHLNYHYSSMEELVLDLIKVWALSGQSVTNQHLSKFIGEPPDKLILEIVEATFQWKKLCPLFSNITPALIHLSHHMPVVSRVMDKVTSEGLNRIQLLLSKLDFEENKIKSVSQSIHLILIGGLLYQLERDEASDLVVSSQIKKTIELLIELKE